MSPAEQCDACSGCRSIHACRQKCGLEPGAAKQLPPPASRKRQGGMALFDALAILILFGLPVVCVALAGPQ